MEATLSKQIAKEMHGPSVSKRKRTEMYWLRSAADEVAVLRLEQAGVWVRSEDACCIRSRTDVYKGDLQIFHCLMVATAEEEGAVFFAFKQITPFSESAPLDFAIG